MTRVSFAIAGLAAGVVIVAATPGCKKPRSAAAATATAVATDLPTDVPKRWVVLRLPSDGLKEVLSRTDAHGFYADYASADPGGLWDKVAAALNAAGYADACSAFDGNVRGFAKGADKLAVKIDAFAGVLALSIFDEQAKEQLLHRACFGKVQVDPPQRIK